MNIVEQSGPGYERVMWDNQLLGPRDGNLLHQCSTLYAPDYAAKCRRRDQRLLH